jgi:hypothetical protein
VVFYSEREILFPGSLKNGGVASMRGFDNINPYMAQIAILQQITANFFIVKGFFINR